MLYCGEHIGNGTLEPKVDIAVDPLDGTTSIAMVSPQQHLGCSIWAGWPWMQGDKGSSLCCTGSAGGSV